MSRFTQDEVRQTVRRWDDIEKGDQPVEKATPEKVDPSLCPCRRELVWVMQPVPGAADIQVPDVRGAWTGRSL
jgi:phytoene dehydrogenase-like protein